MSLRIEIRRTIDEVNLPDWTSVCVPDGDLLMHPRFLEAAEKSMGASARPAPSDCATHFWYLLAYEDDIPVGAACVTEFTLDTMVFASPLAQRVVSLVRRIVPRYLKFRVTFCGLPISTAGSNLRIVAGANSTDVVVALNRQIEQIARERRTWLVVYKEFDRDEIEVLQPLERAGFVRADSLPMNQITHCFDDFAEMLSAMRSHYRYKIAHARKKFVEGNLKLQRTTGLASIERQYPAALHSLYERVAGRAEHRLEILPREFFLELAARFPEELIFTTVSQDDDVLAFAWSLQHGGIYRNLFVGIDYERSEETNAYFNLMVEDIAYAVDQRVKTILVGQTADEFKSRLGCLPDPRYLLIKVTSGWLRWCFLRMQTLFLTPAPQAPDRNVFKQAPACSEITR